ncbi:MAG: D-tyrosyl-tRNA(Tyr) deacylase [Betaproteobacteria bacterium]|nr:MAG: D-tyrosyl-tRNA(Tyr) deacylase [Betaproteobacteria bacterium]
MIALIQRVSEARVAVAGTLVGEIGAGILALVAVERGDGEGEAARLVERVIGYRIFADADGRMNRSLADTGGGLLAVPQFTLAADTTKGARPSFSAAAAPAQGERLFRRFVALARARHPRVATGVFGADMQVRLVNDGPVTFWLRVRPPRPAYDRASAAGGALP